MLNAFQHLGLNKSINNRDRAEKNVREIKKELKNVEAEKPSWAEGVSRYHCGTLRWCAEYRVTGSVASSAARRCSDQETQGKYLVACSNAAP